MLALSLLVGPCNIARHFLHLAMAELVFLVSFRTIQRRFWRQIGTNLTSLAHFWVFHGVIATWHHAEWPPRPLTAHVRRFEITLPCFFFDVDRQHFHFLDLLDVWRLFPLEPLEEVLLKQVVVRDWSLLVAIIHFFLNTSLVHFSGFVLRAKISH